jgi:hypothetical protein
MKGIADTASGVKSVADALREERWAELAGLPPAARVRLALALGRRDLESFRLAQDPPLDPEEAARRLERLRQASRRPSRAIADLIA